MGRRAAHTPVAPVTPVDVLLLVGALAVTLAGLRGWWWLSRGDGLSVEERLYQRLQAFLRRTNQPFAEVVLPGDPEVRLEERVGGGWLFVARWPRELPMAPRNPERRAWTPSEELFAVNCGTVTPWALEEARGLGAVFAIDALRVPWSDPDEDPAHVVGRLRQLWRRIVEPAVEDLAHGVGHNGALRPANLRTLARRDRERARALARGVRPGDGVWLFTEALAVAGDVDDLLARVRGRGEPWIRAAAVRALAEITTPDELLPLATVCSALPETAVAFAEGVATHRTPERDAFVLGAVRSLDAWPEPAARRLALAALAVAPRDEAVLTSLLRAPGEVVERALAALAVHGTVAAVPILRARVSTGALRASAVEPVVSAIQARATGDRGGLSVAVAAGGAVSVADGGGRLADTERR